MARHADGTIVINTAIETDGFKKGSKDMEAAFRKAAHNLEGVSEKIQISIEKSVQAFEKQNAAYREQEARVESLKAKIEEAQSEKVESQAFTDINKQIDDYQKKLDAAIEKEIRFMETGGSTRSTAYERMEYDIEMLREKIAEAKAEKDRLLQSGEAYTGADISGLTSQLTEAQDKLGQMGGKLEVTYASLREKLGEYISSEQEAAIATAETADNTAQATTATEEMSAEVGQAAEKSNIFAQAFERIKAVFATIGAIPHNVRESTAALEESLGIVSQVSGESEQAAESIGEMADETERAAGTGGGFSGVYERVKNTMNNAAGAVKKFFAGIKGSGNPLKKFIKYGLGIASVYMLFNKLRKVISEGIKNFSKFDSVTNKNMSALQSSFSKLKNSIVAAVAPLLNTLLPIVTKVVGYVTSAIDKIGQSLALVFGQKTYTKAADTWEDYANGVDDASNAAKKAQKNFSGLDEISVWDSGSSGGGSPAALFETADISKNAASSPLTGVFETIKDAIEKIKPTLSDLGKAITKIFPILGDMINTLLPPLVDIIAALMPILTQIINTLLPPIRDILNAIMPIIAQVVSVLLPPLTTILTMVVGLIGQLLAAFMPITTQLADILMPVLSEIIGAVMPVLVQLLDAIVPVIMRIAEAILPVVSSLLSLISSVLSALLPILQPFIDMVVSLIDPLLTIIDVILTPIEMGLKSLGWIIDNVVTPAITWLVDKCVKRLTTHFNVLKAVINTLSGVFKTAWSAIKSVWQGAHTFFVGLFSKIWDCIKNTLSKIKNAFVNVFNGIKNAIKTPINGIIGFINKLIGGVTEGLNSVIKAMNNLSFDIPDWVPGLGGKSFGFDIKPLPVKKIPLLASGAVIPPNAPFTAVLGDQKHGTNIEAPLETIKQALREVLGSGTGGGNTYNITATANGKTLFQLLLEEGRNAQMQTGKNPFLLA